jgi:hypothetical protein
MDDPEPSRLGPDRHRRLSGGCDASHELLLPAANRRDRAASRNVTQSLGAGARAAGRRRRAWAWARRGNLNDDDSALRPSPCGGGITGPCPAELGRSRGQIWSGQLRHRSVSKTFLIFSWRRYKCTTNQKTKEMSLSTVCIPKNVKKLKVQSTENLQREKGNSNSC